MENYLVHSAKGTEWSNHKYYKKVNGVYFYSKENYDKFMATAGTQSDTAKAAAAAKGQKLYSTGTATSPSKSTSSSSVSVKTTSGKTTNGKTTKKSSGKKKSSSGSKVKKASNSSKASSKSAGGSKGSGSSKASGEKSSSSKSPKETTSKEKLQNQKAQQPLVDYRTGIKNTLKSAMDLKDDDSVYAKVNDDNQWEVIVETASGKSMKYILDSNYKIVSKENTSNNESEEDEEKKIKHSEIFHHGISGQKWGQRNGPPYPLNYKVHSKIISSSESNKKLGKDYGGDTNPKHIQNNCKEVAEAVLKRRLGVDTNAIAGEKTVKGNLHDYIEAKHYNKKGVEWLGSNGSITPNQSGSSVNRVSNAIKKVYNEGDQGMIGITWDKKYVKPGKEDGHAFNWEYKDGKILYTDDQPDITIKDASEHFSKINKEKEIEVVKITKKAFEK